MVNAISRPVIRAVHSRKATSTTQDFLAPVENLRSLPIEYSRLAQVYSNQGRLEEAEQLYKMALNVAETAMGTSHSGILQHLDDLANYYSNRAKFTEAEPYLKRAYALRLSQFAQSAESQCNGDVYLDLADNVEKLSQVFERTGRKADGEKVFLTLLNGQAKHLGPEHPQTLDALERLGKFYGRINAQAAARIAFERLHELTVKVYGPLTAELGPVYSHLSIVYGKLDLYLEQIKMLEKQVQLVDTVHGGTGLPLAAALTRLADALAHAVRQGVKEDCTVLIEQAELTYIRALSLYEKHYGPKTSTVENLRARLKKLTQA